MNAPHNIDIEISNLRKHWELWCEAYRKRDEEATAWYDAFMRERDARDTMRIACKHIHENASLTLPEVRRIAAMAVEATDTGYRATDSSSEGPTK